MPTATVVRVRWRQIGQPWRRRCHIRSDPIREARSRPPGSIRASPAVKGPPRTKACDVYRAPDPTRGRRAGGGLPHSAPSPATTFPSVRASPTRQPTYMILCKAGEESFSLAARDGKVCLVRTDRDDDTQHWIKDMKYSTRVKDEEGYPAMALINKASGEALKHSLGQSHPLHLWVQEPVLELHQAPARNG